ncbi:MAG: starvation-inducible DNA-binding protein [Sphingobacteriales bacterium]|jgi:starvation-inducible DNA-binding protein
MKNRIGLNQEKSVELIDKLNILLANYQIYYMNVRGFHWNIKGDKFFELHAKFEELYNDLLIKVDEIAERVLTLGGNPTHAYSDYLKLSSIQEVKNTNDSDGTIQSLLSSFNILLSKQRDILEFSSNANDEGTGALMSDYIREQEKLVWMYSAFLNN